MPIEWAIILVVAISDAILLAETSFRLEASSQLKILADLIPLAVLFVICRRWRSFPRITHRLAHLIRTVLALVLFTNVAVILNFILTGILPLPSWDGALATADRQPEEDRAGGVDPVDDSSHAEFFVVGPALGVDHGVAVKARGNFLIRSRVGKQVAGDLLDRELIEG